MSVGARGAAPAGARVIDVTGKTIVPGFVDVHAHMWPLWGLHWTRPWMYLAMLAYGVTTTRDPQTSTTDVLTYGDRVEAGQMPGPGSTPPDPASSGREGISSLEHAHDVLRRYSDYYDTKTFKMYMSGNRRQREWLIMAARDLKLMPTTEGGLDYRLNMTHAMDGYPGVEHTMPITPVFEDVVELFKTSGTTNTPTLLVSYGGPWAENYYYTHENVIGDAKLRHFTPEAELDPQGAAAESRPGAGWLVRRQRVRVQAARRLHQEPGRGRRPRRYRRPRAVAGAGLSLGTVVGGERRHEQLRRRCRDGDNARRPGDRPRPGPRLARTRQARRPGCARRQSARQHPQLEHDSLRDEERPAVRRQHARRGLAATIPAPDEYWRHTAPPSGIAGIQWRWPSEPRSRSSPARWRSALCATASAIAQGPWPPRPPRSRCRSRRRARPSSRRRKGTWISLDVSPDGQTIVFDLLGNLYTMPITGGKATRITSGMAYDAQPRFSPDGKSIVFISDRSGGDNVWTMRLDGTDTTQVTQGNGNLYVSPEWTPDGQVHRRESRGRRPRRCRQAGDVSRRASAALPLIRGPPPFKTLGAASARTAATSGMRRDRATGSTTRSFRRRSSSGTTGRGHVDHDDQPLRLGFPAGDFARRQVAGVRHARRCADRASHPGTRQRRRTLAGLPGAA